MAITTVDGVVKKRGDKAWQVGLNIISLTQSEYKPTLSTMNGKEMDNAGWPNYWHDYKLCQEQCDLLNQSNKI